MSSVYVIGQHEQAIGFTAVGAKAVEANTSEEAMAELRKLISRPDAALILIFESLVADASDEFEDLHLNTDQPLLVIPDHLGSRGLTLKLIKEMIEKSIGVDLLGKENEPGSGN